MPTIFATSTAAPPPKPITALALCVRYATPPASACDAIGLPNTPSNTATSSPACCSDTTHSRVTGSCASARSVTSSGRRLPSSARCLPTVAATPGPKWIAVGKLNVWMVLILNRRSVDLHEAQLEDVVRPLCNRNVRPHHPGQRAPVERDQRKLRVDDAKRIADHLAALGKVGLDAHAVDQRIELRVRIAAAVERAGPAVGEAADDRVQRCPRIGCGRPAELEKAAARLCELRKECRRRERLERDADADLREHAGDRLADGRAERDVDAVERHAEAGRVQTG